MDRTEKLQEMLDLTVELVNDLVFFYPEMSAIELYKLAVSEVLEQCQNETQSIKYNNPIGKVDTNKVAFTLQDNVTAAVIQGDNEFAENIELDYIGADEDDN